MNEYYFVDGQGKQQGPFNVDQLASKGVTGRTYVWRKDMKDWVPASMVPEVAQYLNDSAPVPPEKLMKPNNYMVWTVLSTILCCIPIGAIAVYLSIQVDTYYKQGDYNRAAKASSHAALFAIIAGVVGILCWLFCVPMLMNSLWLYALHF